MFSNNNSYECWSNGTTPLKTEYTHLAARELGSLYVKASSGAYLRHKHEWTLTKIDFKFRPTLISYPFFTPRDALNPDAH
jgi:hypothetical protein